MSTYYISDKEQILWIGEHARRVFNQTHKSVLDNYQNHLLLYSDDGESNEDFMTCSYISNDSNQYSMDYEEQLLNEPVANYIKQVNIPSNVGLIIGSPYELLMKVVVQSSHHAPLKSKKVKTALLFEKAYKMTTQNRSKVQDFTQKSVLFLESNVPFRDLKAEGKEVIKKARQGFSRTIVADEKLNNLSEFLFRYHEDHKEAIHNTSGIIEL
jgi:hypothetical protein